MAQNAIGGSPVGVGGPPVEEEHGRDAGRRAARVDKELRCLAPVWCPGTRLAEFQRKDFGPPLEATRSCCGTTTPHCFEWANKGRMSARPMRWNMPEHAHIRAPASFAASPGRKTPEESASPMRPRHFLTLSGEGVHEKPP